MKDMRDQTRLEQRFKAACRAEARRLAKLAEAKAKEKTK
jgi:hypothetical protein